MEIDRAAAGTPVGPSLQSLNDLKMAESLLKEGRMLGVKAFAIATTMCISGAVLVVGGTRWALDVETVRKFISILPGGHVILPCCRSLAEDQTTKHSEVVHDYDGIDTRVLGKDARAIP